MSSTRVNFSTGSPWEIQVGYSRAVRTGNVVEVSGTVAADDLNGTIGEGSAYLQTKFIIQKIEAALKMAGAELRHVVRTRMYVTDISQWEEYGRAHGECFGQIRPCTSMVEVRQLIAPQYLVEIEATAVIEETADFNA